MNRRKGQTNTTTNDVVDDEIKKFKHAAISSVIKKNRNKQPITRFEDLANEIIHEIFDYLDAYHIYQSFFKLNARFKNLLSHVNVPITASISTFSKSTFQPYYTDFMRPLRHRMKLLDLSDPFIVEYVFPIAEDISMYSQLKTLYLKKIESQYLENLLHRLAVLPSLSSLTMHIGSDANEINIYNRLFQLPVLKYCELSFQRDTVFTALPISSNTSSPIEYLILNNSYDLYAIDAFLSYVPQLRHLSITDANAKLLVLILFDNLRRCSFTLVNGKSDDLERFMKKYSHQIKLVHFCKFHRSYIDHDDAEMWTDSILSYLPPVKTAHLKTLEEITCDYAMEMYASSFFHYNWSTLDVQQYFFTHELISEGNLHKIFRSFTSHRRKHHIIRRISASSDLKCDAENVNRSIRYITIRDEAALNGYAKSFPNATELTCYYTCSTHCIFFTNDALRNKIPVTHLQKLNLIHDYLTFNAVVDILLYLPNLRTLGIWGIHTSAKEVSTLRKSEKFYLVSEQNQIKHIILSYYSLTTVKVLVDLCLQLQHLSFDKNVKYFIEIASYLVSKNTRNYSGISSFSLCMSQLHNKLVNKVQTLVQSKKHIVDYSLKVLQKELYVWWS